MHYDMYTEVGVMKYEKTAKRLMKALSDKNMKAQELADKAKINKASVSQYINGSHAPSNISAGKMAEVLGVSPLWLMGFDVEETAISSTHQKLHAAIDSMSDAQAEALYQLLQIWQSMQGKP